MSSEVVPDDHLAWRKALVDGRPTAYGVAGSGHPVLFLHGWALGQHAYKRAMKRLVQMGCRVYAPAMPGFGGTAELARGRFGMAGYAEWADGFLTAVGVDEPVFCVGHSFGGGVAIKLAHDFPERVRYLVLVNSVGGSAWSSKGTRVRTMAERPLWDWGLNFPSDVFPLHRLHKVLPGVLEDAVPNVVRNPLAVLRASTLARTVDLTAELEELRRRKLPVVVLWGDKDRIIPRASFEALCAAIGSPGEVVAGNHSWLLADPDAFGEVMTNVLAVAQAAQAAGAPPEEAAAAGARAAGAAAAVGVEVDVAAAPAPAVAPAPKAPRAPKKRAPTGDAPRAGRAPKPPAPRKRKAAGADPSPER